MDIKTLQIFNPGLHHAMDGWDSPLSSIDLAATAAVGLFNAVLSH